jgi:hypothetical protein
MARQCAFSGSGGPANASLCWIGVRIPGRQKESHPRHLNLNGGRIQNLRILYAAGKPGKRQIEQHSVTLCSIGLLQKKPTILQQA